MTLFDNMLGNLPSQRAVIGLSVLAALMALAVVAWWCSRRAAARRPLAHTGRHIVEHRAWGFCPRCGWPRPADSFGPLPRPMAHPVRDAIAASCPPASNAAVLPSTLLRKGWAHSPAVDADGRVVLPCDPSAVAWSLWGAANAALEPESPAWQAWVHSARSILAKRHGGVSLQAYNRDPGRTAGEAIALSAQAERRADLGPRPTRASEREGNDDSIPAWKRAPKEPACGGPD